MKAGLDGSKMQNQTFGGVINLEKLSHVFHVSQIWQVNKVRLLMITGSVKHC